MTDEVNHGFDFLTRHPVHRFSCGVWCHGSVVRVQTRICLEVELCPLTRVTRHPSPEPDLPL